MTDVRGPAFAQVFVCLHYVLAVAACKRHHYQILKISKGRKSHHQERGQMRAADQT